MGVPAINEKLFEVAYEMKKHGALEGTTVA